MAREAEYSYAWRMGGGSEEARCLKQGDAGGEVMTKPRVRLRQRSRWAGEKVPGRREQRWRGQGIGKVLHVDAEITHQGGRSRNEEGKSELVKKISHK